MENMLRKMQDHESQLKFYKLVEDVYRRFPKMQTTLSIQQLIAPSTCSRSKAIPRPQNCFMIFRRDVTATSMKEQKIRNRRQTVKILSKIASKKWEKIKKDKRNYPDEDRDLDFWKLLSEIADCHHKLMFPEYRYSPRQKQKRKRCKKINHAIGDNIAPQPLIQPSENVQFNNNVHNESDIVSLTQFVPIDGCGLFSLFDNLQTVNFCDQTGIIDNSLANNYSFIS